MKGKVDISELNTPPEKTELETANYFSEKGKEIKFIRPSSIPGIHRPDILMDGVEWEIKCPVGHSSRTIENNLRKALNQSPNVIFDLRHLRTSENESISYLENRFNKTSRLKKLLIIKKNGDLLKYTKKN
ncbi:MAG: hypothetical protein J5782_01975 [Clostridia bacterium]|nr:hypothetical protein [Clostridia bacterium]